MGFGPPAGEVSVTVVVDGEPVAAVLPVPDGMTACRWAAEDDWLSLFPGHLPSDQAAYWTARLADRSDPLEVGALRLVAYGLAEQVYGSSWWVAHRLCATAATNWFVYESWAVSTGFDPRHAPAPRIVASLWAWRLAMIDPADKTAASSLEKEVFTPPPGAPAADPGQQRDRNRAAFAAFAAGSAPVS